MRIKKICLQWILVFLVTFGSTFSNTLLNVFAENATEDNPVEEVLQDNSTKDNSNQEVIETDTVEYTQQPTSLEEVQQLLNDYNQAVENATTDEELANISILRFEFEVDSTLIPEGYYCKFVEDDEEFGASYYTIAVSISLRSGGVWGGGDGSSWDQAYLIEDAADLKKLADSVTNTEHFEGKYFKLANDIDISAYNWGGIGSTYYFGGNFDGQENTIKGLKGSGSSNYGLFGYVAGATIKNLNIQLASGTFSGSTAVGGLVGRIGANNIHKTTTIENCSVDGNNATISGSTYAGGLVGAINVDATNNSTHRVYISNCSVKNLTVKTSSNYAAGIVGAAYQTTFSNTTVENVNASATIYAGGFAGVTYGVNGYQTEVINCSVKNSSISAGGYAGGFAGAIYEYSKVTNCATIGNGSVYTPGDYIGGFAGAIYGNSEIKSSFSQFDVSSSYAAVVAGGFTGIVYDYASITNCYSNGSINKTNSSYGGYLGSFAGKIHGYSKVSNSYATGTIISNSSTTRPLSGFTSELHITATVINCYYDTTTTRLNIGVGYGNTTTNQIIGLSTKDLILQSTYAFSVTDNTNGKAGTSGNDDNPWYIDDDITYPYLYYQYDNQTGEDVNYNLSALLYSDDTAVGQKRADFTINSTSLPLKTKSVGADKAYFPYSGVSMYAINSSSYTNIPGGTKDSNLWSLGSVSKTGIISFDGVPYAEKTSNRDSLHDDGKTYVGDTITYTITLYNYSTEADYINPVLTDYIPNGLTLISDSVTLKVGDSTISQTLTTDNSSLPYYSYDGVNLTVYLNDLVKSSNGLSYYTITFDVYVEKEAASTFDDDGTYSGNIRNTGKVVGDLQYPDYSVVSDFETTFDDKNDDPVYDVFILKINKTDLANNGLEGATFSLYIWNGITNASPPESKKLVTSSNIVTNTSNEGWYLYKGNMVSGNDGWVTEVQLFEYPKYYQLVENTAPDGYKLPSQQWRFYLNNDGSTVTVSNILDSTATEDSIVLTEITDTAKGTYYQLANSPKIGSITLEKYNQDGSTPLAGATFLIEKEVNGQYVYISWDSIDEEWKESTSEFTQSTVLDQNETTASTVFANLPEGKYRITETTPPSDDYMPLVESIIVDIPTVDNEGQPIYDVSYTIYNSQLLEMPEAGSQYNNWLYLCFGLLIALSAGALLIKHQLEIYYQRKKRREI